MLASDVANGVLVKLTRVLIPVQVSWTLPIDSAQVGDHLVNFYDEAGYKSLLTVWRIQLVHSKQDTYR